MRKEKQISYKEGQLLRPDLWFPTKKFGGYFPMNLFNSKVSNLTRTSRTFEIFPHADKYKKGDTFYDPNKI